MSGHRTDHRQGVEQIVAPARSSADQSATLHHIARQGAPREASSQRRRLEFLRHIGSEVEIKRAHVGKMPSNIGILVDVKRSRAVIQFPNFLRTLVSRDFLGRREVEIVPEEWLVPLTGLLLPGCLESDPRQQPLFEEEGLG